MAGTICKPMLGRKGADEDDDIAYQYRRSLGRYLRHLRTAKGVTQRELADHLGIGVSSISGVELGRTTISPEAYEHVAEFLGADRVLFGKMIVRYTNPWAFSMIFGRDAVLELDQIHSRLPSRADRDDGGEGDA